MKKNLIQALENADAELSSKNSVKIDSELMNHISGGFSSGDYCTISGECNWSRRSCSGGFWNFMKRCVMLDVVSPF